jgi:hypothetical protein
MSHKLSTKKNIILAIPPQISEHHLKWLMDTPMLLREASCMFHHKHMEVVPTEEKTAPIGDFKVMPYLIGSDNSKQFEIQVTIHSPPKKLCVLLQYMCTISKSLQGYLL